MELANIIQLGILIVAVAAIICNQIIANRQNKLQMYAEYTKRYQDIFLKMLDEIIDGTAKVYAITTKYMRLYFDLCSEEYHLWKDKAIANKVWELWIEGMQTECAPPLFKQSWDVLKDYYGQDFQHFFERNIINHSISA